jgi:hypothetical protein
MEESDSFLGRISINGSKRVYRVENRSGTISLFLHETRNSGCLVSHVFAVPPDAWLLCLGENYNNYHWLLIHALHALLGRLTPRCGPTPPFVRSKIYFEQISQKCILLMVVDALFCI